jgi:radical SAM protein with 4Fe4S-binding SPASM domain
LKVTVYYEVTTACPCSCGHCHIPLNLRRDAPLFRSFADFTVDLTLLKKNLKVDSVILSGGEPTLHKDILAIAEFTFSLFKHVSIISNCINPSTLKQLSKYATIWCSLDFYGSKQDEWRGVKGLWQNYEEIKDIANIRATLLRTNQEDIQQLIREAHRQNRKATVVPYKGADPTFTPTLIEMQKLVLYIFNNNLAETVTIDSPDIRMWLATKTPSLMIEAKNSGSLCSACNSVIRVDPNGQVKPCPFLEQTICDLLDPDLQQKIADARQRIITTYTGKCLGCRLKTICGGCKASQNQQCFLTT